LNVSTARTGSPQAARASHNQLILQIEHASRPKREDEAGMVRAIIVIALATIAAAGFVFLIYQFN
jgi:hypothetical protein